MKSAHKRIASVVGFKLAQAFFVYLILAVYFIQPSSNYSAAALDVFSKYITIIAVGVIILLALIYPLIIISPLKSIYGLTRINFWEILDLGFNHFLLFSFKRKALVLYVGIRSPKRFRFIWSSTGVSVEGGDDGLPSFEKLTLDERGILFHLYRFEKRFLDDKSDLTYGVMCDMVGKPKVLMEGGTPFWCLFSSEEAAKNFKGPSGGAIYGEIAADALIPMYESALARGVYLKLVLATPEGNEVLDLINPEFLLEKRDWIETVYQSIKQKY